jgi:hypothetical protein
MTENNCINKYLNRKFLTSSIFFILCFSSVALCVENKHNIHGRDIMSKIDDLIASVKTYKQTIKSYEFGKLTAEIITYYKAPNKFHETTKTYTEEGKIFESIRVEDGFYIWTYMPYLKSVTKEKSKPVIKTNEYIFLKEMKDKDGVYTKINFIKEDKNYYIFEIIKWHENPGIFPKQKTKVFYRKDIGYPDKLIFYDEKGKKQTEMISTYTNLNKPLDDNMFVFHLPNNIIVSDLETQEGPYYKITAGIEGKKKE